MKLLNSMFLHESFSIFFLLQIIDIEGLKVSKLEDVETKLLPKLLDIISRGNSVFNDGPNYREVPESNDVRYKTYGFKPDIPNYRENSRHDDVKVKVYNLEDDHGLYSKDSGSNEVMYKAHNAINDANDIKDFKNRFSNRLVVKRLIPHGLSSGKFEYDAKYNSYYIPLVRLHGAKPKLIHRTREDAKKATKDIFKIIHKHLSKKKSKRSRGADDNDDFDFEQYKKIGERHFETDDLEFDRPVKNRYNDDDDVREIDDELLTPFKVDSRNDELKLNDARGVTIESIKDDIRSYLYAMPNKPEVRRLKYNILDVLENYNPTLRTLIMNSEERDNSALPLMDNTYHELEQPSFRPNLEMPHYSFWDYWLYDKPIYLDKCAKGLVQQGNHCIVLPPH